MAELAPGPDGRLSTDQAAALCGVQPVTVRNWVFRGYVGTDGQRVRLPVTRYKGQLRIDPVELAKAEHATAQRARRMARPTAA